MELRQRVRAAKLHFGKKTPDDPDAVSFWLCEGMTKRHVRGQKTQSLETAMREWELEDVLNNEDAHFMNESSGLVVPRDEELGKHVSDRDVVRVCSPAELGTLMEKFSTRNREADAEMMGQKPPTPISSALSKLKRIGATNPTIKMIQKTFDDRTSPHSEETDLLEHFPDIDPVFENGEVEEISDDEQNGAKMTCDVCEVSWPDDATSRMVRFRKTGIVTHQGCAQFAADILAHSGDNQSREDFLKALHTKEVNRSGTFHVTVHRAMDLPPTQLLGSAAPYAKLSLLPWKEAAQTKPSENGGRNPLWKSMHDNVMQFSHLYNSSITPTPLLEVEVWNSNYISDDQVACTLLDMTPLLRHPTVEAKRWFTLSSRAPNPVSAMVESTGQAKVLLSIRFVPMEGNYILGNAHKFRVHQLKSIGLAIPNCAVCDRVIMNALKGSWGYRCELCGLDVHKSCIMKAMSDCKCTPSPEHGDASKKNGKPDKSSRQTNAPEQLQYNGMQYKLVTDGASRKFGTLFINFQGLHICSKHCQPDREFHSKNIFEGDYYCRLVYDGIVHETSPVLKSADPMFMEKICFQVGRTSSEFRVEVVDFNTDLCIAGLKMSLFQLLQRDADKFVRTNKLLNALKTPLRRLSLSDEDKEAMINSSNDETHVPSNIELCSLLPSSSASKSGTPSNKTIGFVLMEAKYVETKTDLLRTRLADEIVTVDYEEKEFSVESLRETFERLNRAIIAFRWFDAQYDSIISWKNKKKSGVALAVFVYGCIFINLEYAIAYILMGVLVYMLYQLHLRLEGAFARRWIRYAEYEQEQEDKLTLYRPLADLRVAVHEARISQSTDQFLKESQTVLKDVSSSKLGYYVRIKFIPNDKKRSKLGGDTAFIPSGYDETVVATTTVVEKSRAPFWRKNSLSGGLSSSPFALSALMSKQKKSFSLQNFNVSWRHDATNCYCDECVRYRGDSDPAVLPSSKSGAPDLVRSDHCGVDHHAYYFPVPQACRKNFAGIEDLVPWKMFPGVVQFDLCVSLNGETKDPADVVVGTGLIPLRSLLNHRQDVSTSEILVPLSTSPIGPDSVDEHTPLKLFTSPSLASASKLLNDTNSDELLVRVQFDVPSPKLRQRPSVTQDVGENASVAAKDAIRSRKISTSRAERVLSESVYERLIEKEKAAVIGANLLDAFWKVKDTIKKIQGEIENVCGIIASTENLLNWTHPWKTATAFAAVSFVAFVFAFVPGRWLVLLFGISEFGAVYLEDLPPSNYLRKILWNFITSLPTDQDLINVYEREREFYTKTRQREKEKEEEELLRLRHHALWAGELASKLESDRHFKQPYFVVYRAFRFVLWKSVEDAEAGSQPYLTLLFDRSSAVVDTTDDSRYKFRVTGVLSTGSEETRVFAVKTMEALEVLLKIIRQSCAAELRTKAKSL